MDFNVSVGDDDQDIRILAPWFLNCLNADPEKYQKYVNLKGNSDYTRDVEPVIIFLERNRFIRISDVNPAKIAITRIGVDKCNEPTDIEWSYNPTFYPIEDDDDIAKNPGYRNYK